MYIYGESMKTSIRHFRESMRTIFKAVQRGEEIIVYSHKTPIAKIIPIEVSPKMQAEENCGFGMWKDDAETADVSSFTRKLRKGRRRDF